MAAAAVIGTTVIAFFWQFRSPTFKAVPFNAEVWRATPVTDRDAMTLGTVRQTMSDDLVKKRLLIGKTPKEIEVLLGPADHASATDSYYLLGFERGAMAMDAEALHIFFEGGRAVSTKILSH